MRIAVALERHAEGQSCRRTAQRRRPSPRAKGARVSTDGARGPCEEPRPVFEPPRVRSVRTTEVKGVPPSERGSSPRNDRASASPFASSPHSDRASAIHRPVCDAQQTVSDVLSWTIPSVDRASSCALRSSPRSDRASSCALRSSPRSDRASSCALRSSPRSDRASSCALRRSPRTDRASSCALRSSPRSDRASPSAFASIPSVDRSSSWGLVRKLV
jgi:hypothetical protein